MLFVLRRIRAVNTKIHKLRLGFDTDKETKWLNRMAEQGWAMTGFCLGVYRFEKCEPGEYIYQVDIAEGFFSVSESYRQFMEELGVEVVSCWGPWVILRRRAQEGVFEMYTDVESTITRYTKVRKVFQVAGVIECACMFSGIYSAIAQSRFSALGWGSAVAAALVMLLFLREILRLNGILAELNSRLGKKASEAEGPFSLFLSGINKGAVIALVCGVVLYPVLYALLHELGHCIAVWLCGGTVTGFYPFGQDAHMTFEGITDSASLAFVDIGGALLSLVITAALLLVCKGSEKHPLPGIYLGILSGMCLLQLVPWIVIPVCGLLGVTDSGEDICKFISHSGLAPAAVSLGAVIVLVLMFLLSVKRIPALFGGAVGGKFMISVGTFMIALTGIITAVSFCSAVKEVIFAEGNFRYTTEDGGSFMLQEEIPLEVLQPGEYVCYVEWENDGEGVLGGVMLRDAEGEDPLYFSCTGEWLQAESLPFYKEKGQYILSFYLLGSMEDWLEFGRIAGMKEWEWGDMEEYVWQPEGGSAITGSYRIMLCP